MLNSLLPRHVDNTYSGSRVALWVFGLFALIRTMTALMSVFDARRIAVEADRIPLNTFPTAAADTAVLLFALLGLSNLVIGMLSAVVLARYRSLVPLMLFLLVLELAGRKLLLRFLPIPRIGAPPAFPLTLTLLLIAVIALALSLRTIRLPKRSAPAAANFLLFTLCLAAAGSLPAQPSLIEQGLAAISRGDSAAAIRILEKAVAQTPGSADAHFHLANAHAEEGMKAGMLRARKHISKMREGYERAIALDPKHIEARVGLVQFHTAAPGFMGGSYDEALERARQIKAIDAVEGHRAYALVYSHQKKLDLARNEYAAALRVHPDSPKAHTFFGRHLAVAEKNHVAAFAEFEVALKLDPTHMAAFYHLGRTAAVANANLKRGEEALKKYIAYTPKANEPTLANAHYFLGLIHENAGRKAEARKSYEAALKLNPSLKKASDGLKGL